MKVNIFTTILLITLSGIIAFFLSFYVSGENKFILGFGSFITFSITLIGSLSVSFEYKRTTALTRITSGVFFTLVLISQIIFTVINNFQLPTYILVTGCTPIIHALVVYGISKSTH